MPVVISELIVRATVGAPEKTEKTRSDSEKREDRARLVEDTVAEVMRILRRAEEP